MPRKPLLENYDPISADLARDVATTGRVLPSPPGSRTLEPPARLEPTQSEFPEVPRTEMIAKRLLLTRVEDDDFNAFLLRLQQSSGTKVPASVILRAALSLVLAAEEAIVSELTRHKPKRMPSTHDRLAQGAFEDWWMHCLGRALQRRLGSLGNRMEIV